MKIKIHPQPAVPRNSGGRLNAIIVRLRDDSASVVDVCRMETAQVLFRRLQDANESGTAAKNSFQSERTR